MLRKYASLQVLESWRAPAHGSRETLRKRAHRVGFDYQPRPGYLYVRSRMISSRCNDNHDEFPAGEIEKAYRTFLGKPVFVNHHNANHRRARGVIVAVALHRDRNRDGTPDTWVEGLMEIDAMRFPKLAKAVLAGRVNRTSMGVDVEKSTCSACGNVATSPAEYCRHLPSMKGKKHRRRVEGRVREEIIREVCAGLSFFENSLLVEDPADPTAYVLGKPDDRGLKMAATKRQAGTVPEPWEVPGPNGLVHKGCIRCGTPFQSPDSPGSAVGNWRHQQLPYLCNDCAIGHVGQPSEAGKPRSLEVSQDGMGRKQERASEGGIPQMRGWTPDDALLHSTSRRRAPVEAASRPAYENPADHPFYQANPPSSRYIVEAYHGTTDNERALGSRWYADAHHIAKAIAGGDADAGAGVLSSYSPQASWPVNMHNAARAFISHAQGKEIPGKGSGAMDMHRNAAKRILGGEHYSSALRAPKTNAFAHTIAHGGQAPGATGRDRRVVIDRHAMSVAIGRRVTKDDDLSFLGNPHYYNHVAHLYQDATDILSAHFQRPMSVEEVQAATWLRQQRLNRAADENTAAGKGRVSRERNDFARWHDYTHGHDELSRGDGENMHLQGARRATAYGETKVPQQVDTLRAENCPVCGEQDVWSGDRCPVCGFTAPPDMFRDPDTDKASQVRDQLTQDGEVTLPPDGTQPGAATAQGPVGDEQQGSFPDADAQLMHPDQLTPNGTPGVADEEGEPLNPDAEAEQAQQEEQLGEEEEEQGAEEEEDAGSKMLGCPACGEQLDAGDGAEAGDPCPVCGQAPLEPVDEEDAAQKGQEPPQPGGNSKMSAAKQAARDAELRRVAAIERENQILRAQLRFVAELAGVAPELERIRRRADMMNPASPVPDPPQGPPSETTEQALAPETMDDPSRPGTTPGSVTHVPAEQTTTAITPGVEIQTPPATQLVDVTAPVQGTNPSQDGGVPIEQRRIETDVRVNPNPLAAEGPGIGGVGNDGTAYPWVIGARPEDGQQKAASAADQAGARTFASIRLAKLRVQAGLEQGDELAVAAKIEKDAALPMQVIEREIETLGKLAARPQAPGRPMQRAASRPPSLAPAPAPMMALASAANHGVDDSDLFLD